ncbi:hypothetical protein [Chryseobacterium sp. MMS23-Vi53]|uniref:hypothetical protein n=1 Tax=Chryseobacterium sp. MMS23-Vi53 TaxID=3386644 RepID=UPI0039EC98F1
MRLNILKLEVVLQTIISFVSLLVITFDYFQNNEGTDFFIALFFVGVSNLLGFLIRICLFASRFHRYYFFGVAQFFVLLYFAAVYSESFNEKFIFYFMGIGGVLFNIYYLCYGFYLIKNIENNKKEG